VTAATCCAVRGFMAPWIPVSFLGIELALASKPWRRRLLPIFLAGFGMSQFYASFSVRARSTRCCCWRHTSPIAPF